MKKLSVILPVYNEELLLPLFLENIGPYVDQLVVVDGGPAGPSSDRTAEIAQDYGEKVVYLSGIYRTSTGTWDVSRQKNEALSKATGDVLLFLSADVLFERMDVLRDIIVADSDHKLYYSSAIEFWLDISHQRLISGEGEISAFPGLNRLVAVDAGLSPYFDENGVMDFGSDHGLDDRLVVGESVKLHMGWIRAFRQQVEKHIRHVHQRRWGAIGESLLAQSSSRDLDAWAISHVLSYPTMDHVAYKDELCSEIPQLADMSYNQNFEVVLEEFKTKYGVSVFKAKNFVIPSARVA
jgi:glycosyltransferase involved in cell wall biosynthesis